MIPDEFAVNQPSIDIAPMRQPLTLIESLEESATSPALPLASPANATHSPANVTLTQMPEGFSINHSKIEAIPERPNLKRNFTRAHLQVPGTSRKSWR